MRRDAVTPRRRARAALPGTPAVLLALPLVLGGLLAPGAPPGVAASAPAARRWIGHRRRAVAEGLTPQGRHALAALALGWGAERVAQGLLQPLAPLDRAGDPRAQQTLARMILRRRPVGRVRRRRAIRRLQLALAGRPQDDALRYQLADLLRASGARQQACEMLRPSLGRRPDWWPLVAQLQWDAALELTSSDPVEGARRRQAARADARAAAERLRGQVAQRPRDPALRLQLARMLRLLARGPELIRVLGPPLSPGANAAQRRQRRSWLAEALVLSARAAAPAERRGLLEQALALDPRNLAVLDGLVDTAHTAEGAWARAHLRRLEREHGRDLAALHGLWGHQAWAQGRREAAIGHLERAHAAGGPYAAVLANDLAYMLAHVEPPQLERALALVQRALAARPGDPRFRDTRARIWLKLDRPRDALADFRAWLPAADDQAEAHTRIAECCERLGMTSLAARHRAAAAIKR